MFNELEKVSHGAPYRHFKSKESLLSVLSDRIFKEFVGELQKLRFRSDYDEMQKLEAHITWIQSYCEKHPKRGELLCQRKIADCEDYFREFDRMLTDEYGEVFWQYLCGCMVNGSVQNLDRFLRLIR